MKDTRSESSFLNLHLEIINYQFTIAFPHRTETRPSLESSEHTGISEQDDGPTTRRARVPVLPVFQQTAQCCPVTARNASRPSAPISPDDSWGTTKYSKGTKRKRVAVRPSQDIARRAIVVTWDQNSRPFFTFESFVRLTFGFFAGRANSGRG